MSSHYEGFPMVMIEAMSCGLPVVSFDFKCGPKDIIKHGENGLIVNDGDIEGLAKAMMTLMNSDIYRQYLSRNTQNIVNNFSEKNVMTKWVELFEKLISS